LLAYYWPQYSSHLKGDILDLSEEVPTAFHSISYWMASGHIDPPVSVMGAIDIVDVYLLAVKWDIRAVQNLAISALFRKFMGKPNDMPLGLFSKIYNNTSPGSSLRGFFVEYLVNFWDFKMDERHEK
jgi:hypothetical protein